MPILPTIVLYDKGANGAPTTTNPQPLRGLDGYAHTISDRFGFESVSCGWAAARADVLEWARVDHLGRNMEAFSPDGKPIWNGRLVEVAVTVGTKKLVFSLKDMANRLTLRYTTDAGAQATTTTYSASASIASFGTKDRLLNLSTVSATAADTRVQTALNQIAYPTVKQSSEAGTGGGGELRVDLSFAGWYGALDDLLVTSTSTTSTATNTQVSSLLTTYNSTNAYFHATPDLVATGVSDTEYIDDNSTYREKIETLLAHGNSSKQRLAWGVYEDRRFRSEVWAGASPTTITYYERGSLITDAAGNVVAPWDVRPNAMAQLLDVLDSTLDGAIEGPTRKYVARVSCRIDSSGASVTLEPDSVDTLDALLSSPTGAGPAGVSDRQAAFERKITKPARTVFSGTDGRVDLGGGSITTPGGVVTITPPGGGTVTLPTGTASVLDGSGSAGQLAKWTGTTTLGNATAGTDYASAGHTHTPSGTGLAPIGAKYIVQQADSDLTNEQSLGALATGMMKSTTTTGVVSTVTGTSGRITEWSDGTTIGASTLVKSGAGVLTLSAGSSYTLTISGGSATLDFTTPSSGDVLQYDGTKFAPTALSAGAPTNATYITQTANGTLSNEQALSSLSTGMVKVTTSTGVLSSVTGTSGRITEWSDGTTIGASTLVKSGAGVLTLSAGSTYTLTVPATGTAALGTGSADQVAYWNTSNVLASAPIYYDSGTGRIGINDSTPSYTLDVNATMRATSGISAGTPATTAAGGQMRAQGRIQTDEFFESAAGYQWDLGTYVAGGTITPAQGRVSISINGTTYFLLARTS